MTARGSQSFARRALAALTVATVLMTAACAAPGDPGPRPSTADPSSTADLASAAPGALLAPPTPLQPVDLRISRAGAQAQRITYRSTSGIDGSPTAVTGSVFTPRTTPPAGGWPIIAFAHPTVGLLEDCAPSAHTDLLGMAPQIELLLAQGYLVVMPDYQGLGSKGPHPYLEPRTAAFNLIDAVRAAREAENSAGAKWAAYGASQGGQASWAAAELAPTYGAGMEMVGAAALVPIVDLASLPQTAFDRRLSDYQLPVMQFIVNSVASVDPSFRLEDYLNGFAFDNNAKLLQCSGNGLVERNRLVIDLAPENVAPRDQAAVDRMAAFLQAWSVPLAGDPSPVPVYAVAGSVDDMAVPASVEDAARRSCDRGDVVVWTLRDDEGHDDVDFRPALAWLKERFEGVPVGGACAFPGG